AARRDRAAGVAPCGAPPPAGAAAVRAGTLGSAVCHRDLGPTEGSTRTDGPRSRAPGDGGTGPPGAGRGGDPPAHRPTPAERSQSTGRQKHVIASDLE